MFLRDKPTMTLTELADQVGLPGESVSVSGTDIRLEIDGEEQSIHVGSRTVPFSEAGAEALSSFTQIPVPFMKRLLSNGAADVAVDLTNTLLARNPQMVIARIDDTRGLVRLNEPGQKVIDPRGVVDVAMRVLGPDSLVVEQMLSTGEFFFDAFMPTNEYGDKRVKDITRAGLRFSQNIKQNLAPVVAPFMYRLICTNGMQTRSEGLAVDARGGTVDEVLANLEAMAQLAFSRVEKDIEHFYALRDVPAPNPERILSRMATEHNLSDRMRLRLIDAIPTVLGDSGEASMFDLVNLVTNTANDPEVAGRRGNRLAFERFGGAAVDDHASRCRSCSSKLN